MYSCLSRMGGIFIFLSCVIYNLHALADTRNRSITSYFVDNVIFQILHSGGYYSVIIISILSIFSYFSRRFRQVFFGTILAILGVVGLVFIYEALEDFEFIPTVYKY